MELLNTAAKMFIALLLVLRVKILIMIKKIEVLLLPHPSLLFFHFDLKRIMVGPRARK